MAKSLKQRKIRRPNTSAQKRTYLKQSDVPSASLDEALRMPQALFDHYAGKPASPMHVAKALNMAPNGSQIVVLSGAAIAFGLIEGGAQASTISATELSRQILRPRLEGEDYKAKQEAVLKPRIFNEFLTKYDGNPVPRRDIAQNVLEDMGVPRERTEEVLERILGSAQSVGFLQEIKGKQYFSLENTNTTSAEKREVGTEQTLDPLPEEDMPKINEPAPPSIAKPSLSPTHSIALTMARLDDVRRSRVFITHGKNADLVEPIKKLLEFGELEPVISVEKQSVSKPVPEKVMDDMRSCGAAIIHVEAEQTIADREGNLHTILNPNVLRNL